MTDLIIGLPSKGRLQEQTFDLFAAAGMQISKRGGDRTYQATISGPVSAQVTLLSASEITSHLSNGSIHAGVTGEDLLREKLDEADKVAEILQPLGFGYADVVVAVPDFWSDVVTMNDLDDVAATFRNLYGRRLRVATKYWATTQRFFSGHGIDRYRIVESLGATEGAPASGTADIIVDITTSGATLTANHLRILEDGIILNSQAMLIRSKSADFTPQQTADLAQLSSAMGAVLAAKL
jgi:ATP phosphoribosyltransferase